MDSLQELDADVFKVSARKRAQNSKRFASDVARLQIIKVICLAVASDEKV